MEGFMIRPTVCRYRTAKEFAGDLMLGAGDLVITNEAVYQPYFEKLER